MKRPVFPSCDSSSPSNQNHTAMQGWEVLPHHQCFLMPSPKHTVWKDSAPGHTWTKLLSTTVTLMPAKGVYPFHDWAACQALNSSIIIRRAKVFVHNSISIVAQGSHMTIKDIIGFHMKCQNTHWNISIYIYWDTDLWIFPYNLILFSWSYILLLLYNL